MFNNIDSKREVENSRQPFGRAVVIGGSVAGLTAARVLAKHFEQVTVIERSPMVDGSDFPKGVPQARHPHLLLIRGERVLEEFFPGLKQDLLDEGAQMVNFGRDVQMRSPYGWLPHYETDLEGIAASRIMLDHAIYQQIAMNPKVTVRSNSEVMNICTDERRRRVIGVQIHNRASGRVEDVPAELVVDASGRSSKAPQWFSQLGYNPPEEQTVNAFPGYATRIFKIPEDFDGGWKAIYLMPNPPHITRGAIIAPLDKKRWHVCLIGMNGDYPPTNEREFMNFARSLVSSEVYDAIKGAEPLSPVWGYRHAENRMRRFDKMHRYLEGFVALGDSVYALNPVYGQGMTLAAIAGQLLDQKLGEQAANSETNDFAGMAERFQKQLQKELQIPWQTATNEDMRWPDTEGKQELDPVSKFIGRYFDLVFKAMPHSTKVTDAFFHVQHMIASPALLLRPDILLNVLKTNLSQRFSNA